MSYVAKSIAKLLRRWALEHGIDFEESDQRDLVDEEPEGPSGYVPQLAVHRVFEKVKSEADNRPVGLIVGAACNVEQLGLVTRIACHSGTLREAVQAYIEYQALAHPPVASHELDEEAGTDTIAVAPSDNPLVDSTREARISFGFGLARNWIRQLVDDPTVNPVAVEFFHADDRFAETYRDFFDAPVSFDCPDNRLVFARELFDRRVVAADLATRPYLERLAELRGEKLEEYVERAGDLVRRVSSFLRNRLGSGSIDQQELARRLGMSTRTLQRRLEDEGIEYRELVDRLRRQKARQLLAETDKTIGEIAYELGYSRNSSFHRAFKRWTDMTPTEYRRQRSE
jgi:AraC-like DNA-binding protein